MHNGKYQCHNLWQSSAVLPNNCDLLAAQQEPMSQWKILASFPENKQRETDGEDN